MSHTPEEKIRSKPLTPLSTGQMSLSLKNKLKRCGRYHTSTPAKRFCPDTLTIDSSPILPTEPPELSNISRESLQLKQNNSSSSSLCGAQEGDSPGRLDTMGQSKSLTGRSVHSLQSPAGRHFFHSPFLTKNTGSSFVSPSDKTASWTPSSKRKGRLLIRSAKLNFDQSDVKAEDDGHKLNLCVEEKSLSSLPNSADLGGASQLSIENKQGISSHTFISEKENSTASDISLKPKMSQKTVSLNRQKLGTSKQALLQEIKEKEETLRKLKMVKMYRSKNNLSHLQTLIDKWRDASQQSLQDLLGLLPEPKPSMSELLHHLQVEQDLVNYDPVEETFT
ncbi:swi5-dependent recombination DNA repair protein 1 homolog [Gigantopelta aegis]|uniref:swi5-dependent recombination DNA repair protein 1 homolog n=1 Tax=Gigantopelta aegis TaxID=1735272 RepID=UPI001B88AAEF|nr:swi5-dependent recombination DNA repair protein 1 homolog [Gigantopelta aegis]XP_041370371.1 swi5-dependent recombination DNA repair protein 1 homolog [Gigantopelta aegis]XP_041370372.1 swi5-dependent recombination DNA repair protein 1 homolog [Gigantopelta aegis]XP_041370373.1 swi5-dependent recombination DNA repair protein 1 homolog [Gigantopelta aegis]